MYLFVGETPALFIKMIEEMYLKSLDLAVDYYQNDRYMYMGDLGLYIMRLIREEPEKYIYNVDGEADRVVEFVDKEKGFILNKLFKKEFCL